MNSKVSIISNEKCWMEQTAITQLEKLVELPGVVRAVGLPDLHAGKSPIGIAVETEGIFYPHLIGNDIGCGMGLFQTGIGLRKFKQDRFVTRLNHIRALEDLPTKNPYPVEELFDREAFETLGIGREDLLLLVHSGSRGYGQHILKEFLDYNGLSAKSEKAQAYLCAHDDALLWAKRNRELVAGKLVEWLGFGSGVNLIADCVHNFLEEERGCYLHRKGAVSAKKGLAVIPGSRGSLTYLVLPARDTCISADSLSHGAGRKWARSLCKSRIRDKYDRDTIRQTKLKSKVVCHDTELLYQEALEAYKNIVIFLCLNHYFIQPVAYSGVLCFYESFFQYFDRLAQIFFCIIGLRQD